MNKRGVEVITCESCDCPCWKLFAPPLCPSCVTLYHDSTDCAVPSCTKNCASLAKEWERRKGEQKSGTTTKIITCQTCQIEAPDLFKVVPLCENCALDLHNRSECDIKSCSCHCPFLCEQWEKENPEDLVTYFLTHILTGRTAILKLLSCATTITKGELEKIQVLIGASNPTLFSITHKLSNQEFLKLQINEKERSLLLFFHQVLPKLPAAYTEICCGVVGSENVDDFLQLDEKKIDLLVAIKEQVQK